jgi:hypothetical protein
LLHHVVDRQQRAALEQTFDVADVCYPSALQINTMRHTKNALGIRKGAHQKWAGQEGAMMRNVQIALALSSDVITLDVPQKSPDMRG